MCVICVKKSGVMFPEKKILENCFDNNPDGAGFMYAKNGRVEIRKGFEDFEAFWKALSKARKITGDKAPYVMHFRIATQGYEVGMTHPFPLSTKMSSLKKLKCGCNIGVAHNGVLSLTSDGSKDYSDTMKFVTDYLSLIIRSYTWHKDPRNTLLIERLIKGSRFAILDKFGHIETLGEGWVQDGDLMFSNKSYSYANKYKDWDAWDSVPWWGAKWHTNYANSGYEQDWNYWKNQSGKYDFTEDYCPMSEEDDDAYCGSCSNAKNCPYLQAVMKDIDEACSRRLA